MEENVDHRELGEAEEALSLRDLQLNENNDDDDYNKKKPNQALRPSLSSSLSSSEPPEFFEFLSNLSSHDMSPAEDIIFCGKLVPFKDHHTHFSPPPQALSRLEYKKHAAFRRRSESLSELKTSVCRSSSTKTKLMRNSRSLDYRKLRGASRNSASPESEIQRNSSLKSAGKPDVAAKKVVKPRWYVFMFGMVKFPPEMKLKDIKSRQFRRNPSVMFPPVDAGTGFPINRNSGRGSWGFLKALSCKDHSSIPVTASFFIPQA